MYICIMIKNIKINIPPQFSLEVNDIKKFVSKNYSIKYNEINYINIIKRSIDARHKKVKIILDLEVYINENFKESENIKQNYKNVEKSEKILIIGSGPAGIFAALKCLEKGKKPIVLERGKNISNRKIDLSKINKHHIVNENSNYCFGEGGAGTFSDGKLYTRSKKRGDVNRILEILINHGADPKIKIDSQPHIGTNKLPKIITNIRKTIINHGGSILFNKKVTNLIIKNQEIIGVEVNKEEYFYCNKVILATGHSARDIYQIFNKNKIDIELKTFAVGVRIEHRQKLINKIQYNNHDKNKFLPPASYSIKTQINGRGVYSFCMCPGGVIAPCATKSGEIVTNGWSPSKRNYPTSNSGFVVELKKSDFNQYEKYGPLAGVEFQKEIERKACMLAGGNQKAPAQRLIDYIDNKTSEDLGKTSYFPGISSVNLSKIFPEYINQSLREALEIFGDKMKGFLTNDAIVHAPETRTSSPVRIPRDKITLQHTSIKGLYPCGEGAGYAGGIISAAIDGEKCAEKC